MYTCQIKKRLIVHITVKDGGRIKTLELGVGITSETDIAIYCNISFKYCDILQYIEQASRIRKTRHILLKLIKK